MLDDDNVKQQEIRELAYKIWEEAGSPEGQEHQFWDKARLLLATSQSEHGGDNLATEK
jgi:hypothetical protein